VPTFVDGGVSHSLHFIQYSVSSIYKVYGFLWKKILVVACATIHALSAVPVHQNELLSSHCLFEWPKHVVNHLGLGQVSMAPQNASLGLLQLLHRQYGAEHCHVAKGHL
jgi:hypothetical protein